MPDVNRSTIEEQVRVILRLLTSRKKIIRPSPIFDTCIKWVQNFPDFIDQSLKEDLKHAICLTFEISEAELLASIAGVIIPTSALRITLPEEDLRAYLPKGGWFEWYDEYTAYNEAPLSYHIFSSLCILGAALGRRVYLDMGHFKVWPNYCIILVGPTGRVKKSTAADIATDFIRRHALCQVLADAPSPEGMIKSLAGNGHCFIYAGEMVTFFGREQYKQGMIPKMLRMLDSPAQFEVETISRGKETLTELAINFLGGTTPGNFNLMPSEMTSSGSMNRYILVVERDTDRIFPRPWKGKGIEQLDETVKRLSKLIGVVDFAPGVEHGWWDNWYHERKKLIRSMADDTMVEATERHQIHLLKTAMLMHLVQCDNFMLCENCLESSSKLLQYIERSVPKMLQGLKQSVAANESDIVYEMLSHLGGAADHSTLLRRCHPKLKGGGAQAFRQHVRTLEEQGKIKISKRGFSQMYVIAAEKGEEAAVRGWKEIAKEVIQ